MFRNNLFLFVWFLKRKILFILNWLFTFNLLYLWFWMQDRLAIIIFINLSMLSMIWRKVVWRAIWLREVHYCLWWMLEWGLYVEMLGLLAHHIMYASFWDIWVGVRVMDSVICLLVKIVSIMILIRNRRDGRSSIHFPLVWQPKIFWNISLLRIRNYFSKRFCLCLCLNIGSICLICFDLLHEFLDINLILFADSHISLIY